MIRDPIPKPCPLAKKPLVEAILELRWELIKSDGELTQDRGFRIALGRYYDSIRGDYPFYQDLPTAQVPESMTAYVVRHQFRKAQDKWPVSQIGPGILTVNETSGYTWDSFRPRLLSAIRAIFKSYPSDISPFNPIGVQLRYVDAIPYDPDKHDPVRFLSEYLHTSLRIDPQLFQNPDKPDAPNHLSLNLTFPLLDPAGVAILAIASGARDEKPSIILEISIRSQGDDVPKEQDDFGAWLDAAHNVAEKWFFTLCRGELLQTFEPVHAESND